VVRVSARKVSDFIVTIVVASFSKKLILKFLNESLVTWAHALGESKQTPTVHES